MLALQSSTPAWADSEPLSSTDYDSLPAPTYDYSYWSKQVKEPDRVRYEIDPLGQRDIVQRVEVHPGDNGVLSSIHGERAEVTHTSDLGGFVDGQSIVISWSTLIDSSFASPTGGWNSFTQIHAAGAGQKAPWQLSLVGDDAELKLRLYGGGEWRDYGQPEGSVVEWIPLGVLQKERWHDFVAEVQFGCSGNGSTKVWLDGILLVDASDRSIGYCGDPGLYWKQGFYRASYPQTTRLWFDNTYRWADLSDAFAHYGWDVADR